MVKTLGRRHDTRNDDFHPPAIQQLAIIEYDPATHDIKTRSLHFFEDEEIKVGFVLGRVVFQEK